MNEVKDRLFTYFTGSLFELIHDAKERSTGLVKKALFPASAKLVKDLHELGVEIQEDYVHVVDNNAIRHTLNQHSSKDEKLRGQIELTEEYLLMIPEVVTDYDFVASTKNRRNQDVILYSKMFATGETIYVEEVRVGRKELAMDTMYIHKKK